MAKKEEYNPSAAAVYGAAFVSVLLGLTGAVINLTATAVTSVPELPKEEKIDATAVYFVKGTERKGSGWKNKRASFASGRTVSVSEGELNVWARTTFKPKPKAEKEPGSALLGIRVIPSPPNFKIEGDSLQIASAINIPLVGKSRSFMYQVKGTFKEKGGVQVFVPSKSSIGSCPIPILSNFFFNFLAGSFYSHDEYAALISSWAKLGSLTLKEAELTLTIP